MPPPLPRAPARSAVVAGPGSVVVSALLLVMKITLMAARRVDESGRRQG